MTYTIWYDSYYYMYDLPLHNVIGQYDTAEQAIAAMRIHALKDMKTFILRHSDASDRTPPWVIMDDEEDDWITSFRLGILDIVPTNGRFYAHVKVEFRVIEIDRLDESLSDTEEQMILQLLKHHSGPVDTCVPMEE